MGIRLGVDWVRLYCSDIFSTKLHRLRENLGASVLALSPADLAGLAAALAAVTVKGARLPEAVLKMTGL